jgi:hypothetical protein
MFSLAYGKSSVLQKTYEIHMRTMLNVLYMGYAVDQGDECHLNSTHLKSDSNKPFGLNNSSSCVAAAKTPPE